MRWEFVHRANGKSDFALTLDGVLLAGGFRSLEALVKMEPESKRNTLIVEMSKHSDQPVGHFQGCDNEALVAKAAVAVFLIKAGLADATQLKRQSDETQRKTLINANPGHTKRSVHDLGKMTNRELVRLAFTWAG